MMFFQLLAFFMVFAACVGMGVLLGAIGAAIRLYRERPSTSPRMPGWMAPAMALGGTIGYGVALCNTRKLFDQVPRLRRYVQLELAWLALALVTAVATAFDTYAAAKVFTIVAGTAVLGIGLVQLVMLVALARDKAALPADREVAFAFWRAYAVTAVAALVLAPLGAVLLNTLGAFWSYLAGLGIVAVVAYAVVQNLRARFVLLARAYATLEATPAEPVAEAPASGESQV